MTTKQELQAKMAQILDAIYEEGRAFERRTIFNAIGVSGNQVRINPAEFTTGTGAKLGRPRKFVRVPVDQSYEPDIQRRTPEPRFTSDLRKRKGGRRLGTLDGTVALIDAKIAELKPAVVYTKDLLIWGRPAAHGTIYRSLAMMVRQGKLTKLDTGVYQPVVAS